MTSNEVRQGRNWGSPTSCPNSSVPIFVKAFGCDQGWRMEEDRENQILHHHLCKEGQGKISKFRCTVNKAGTVNWWAGAIKWLGRSCNANHCFSRFLIIQYFMSHKDLPWDWCSYSVTINSSLLGWMNGCVDGCMDGWKDGCKDE